MNEQRSSASGGIWVWLCVLLLLVTAGMVALGYKHHWRVTTELKEMNDYLGAKARDLERRVDQLEVENNELRKRLEPAE
jgi:hypothetical protein